MSHRSSLLHVLDQPRVCLFHGQHFTLLTEPTQGTYSISYHGSHIHESCLGEGVGMGRLEEFLVFPAPHLPGCVLEQHLGASVRTYSDRSYTGYSSSQSVSNNYASLSTGPYRFKLKR